ncbi:MAG: pantetheine-phosphate adenylyltransferase [Bacteroidales bacterium]
MKTTALFPGTFDPFTIGHYSLVERGLALVDEIVIAIGVNEDKKSFYSLQERMEYLEKLYEKEPRVSIRAYNSLTIDFAREKGAQFILRGIRSLHDFEYEKGMADFNRALSGIETIILFTEPKYAHISSSFVRELVRHGQSTSSFVPPLETDPFFYTNAKLYEQSNHLSAADNRLYLPGCRTGAGTGGIKKTFHSLVRRIKLVCGRNKYR